MSKEYPPQMKHFSENHPLQASFVLILIAFLLRIVDVFVVRSDELFGEQVLTKVVVLILIVVYARSVKGDLDCIGLHAVRWQISVILGLLVMALGLIFGYGVEWLFLCLTGESPRLFIAAQGHTLIPENAATGGFFFALTLCSGNFVNSFMEEGLFRGILITHMGSRMSLMKANLIQASLFGIWHIVWPIRDYLDGRTGLLTVVGMSAGYILLSGMIGFAWGYFYQKTNSLWASWSAHTLNNTIMNFFHITTAAGMPSTLGLRVAVITLTVVGLLPLFRKVSASRNMPEVITWA